MKTAKKLLSMLLALAMILSVLSVPVSAETGADPVTLNNQSWSLANPVENGDGTVSVDVVLKTSYPTGAIQFIVASSNTDVLSFKSAAIGTAITGTVYSQSDGLVSILPDSYAAVDGVIATVTFTYSGSGEAEINIENDPKTDDNIEGSLIASRVDNDGNIYYGQIATVSDTAMLFPMALGYLTFSLNSDGNSYSVTDCDTSASGILNIPASYKGLPVTAIGDSAFSKCNGLTRIVIPDSVISIGKSAFNGCNILASVKIGNGVETIGQYAFAYCPKLTDITIGTGLSTIEANAFFSSPLIKNVYISDLAKWCQINFNFTYSSTSYCNSPMYKGENLYLNGELLTNVVIPEGVTAISDGAFYSCDKITGVTIPGTVEAIGEYAFSNCPGLKYAVFENGVTEVNGSCFTNSSLSNLVVAESVTAIDFSALASLPVVFYTGTAEQWLHVTTSDNMNTVELHTDCTKKTLESDCLYPNRVVYACPYCGEYLLLSEYGEALGHEPASDWVIDLAPTCTTVGKKTLHCSRCDIVMRTSQIPKDNTAHDYSTEWTIDKEATCTEAGSKSHHCTRCGDKTDITETDAALGHDYSDLWEKDVEVTETVDGELSRHCSRCDAKTDVIIISAEHGLCFTLIDDGTAYGVTPVYDEFQGMYMGSARDKEVVIPSTFRGLPVTRILDYAFWGCQEMTSIRIPDSIVTIGDYAFEHCYMSTIIIPDGVVSIGKGAFMPNMYSYIVIPASVTSFDISQCTAEHLFYMGTEAQWTELVGNSSVPVVEIHLNCTVTHKESDCKYGERDIYACPDCLKEFADVSGEPTGHSYVIESIKDATCDDAGYEKYACLDCGDSYTIEKPALGHSYSDEWTVDKEATCTEEGSKSRHCSNCDSKVDVTAIPVDSNAHSYSGEWVIDKEATCTEDGSQSRHCVSCGASSASMIILALGHEYSDNYTVDIEPTESSDGEQSRHCTRCDARTDITVIPAVTYLEFTLNSDGVSYSVTDCYTAAEGEVIIPGVFNGLPVTAIDTAAFAACKAITSVIIPDGVTTIGNNAFAACSNITSISIPDSVTTIGNSTFNGCSAMTSIDIPQSVTSIGINAFTNCKSLTYLIIPDSVTTIARSAFLNCAALTAIVIPDSVTSIGTLPKMSGTFATDIFFMGTSDQWYSVLEGVSSTASINLHCNCTVTSVESTCTDYAKDVYDCPDCDATFEKINTDEPLAHKYSEEWIIDKEATCIEAGSKSHHCIYCGDKIDITVIPAGGTAHTYSDEWTVDKEATCAEEGSKSRHCTVCGDKTDITAIEKTEHSYSIIETVAPDCDSTGYEEYCCDACGEYYTVELPAVGHTYSDEWTVDKEPTCAEEGSKSRHCTVCGDKTDITAIEKTEHNYVVIEAIAPDCDSTGYKEYCCLDCGYSYTEKLPATGHTFGEWSQTVAPTCTTEGEEHRTCINTITYGVTCDYEETRTVDALGHEFSDEWTVDKEATCTEDGSKSRHCTRCDEKTDVTVIGATGHTLSTWSQTVAPTCTTEGEEHRTCINTSTDGVTCDYEETRTVDALGHDFSSEWTIDVEQLGWNEGEKSRHCSRCDERTDITVIPVDEVNGELITYVLNDDGTAYTLTACDTTAEGVVYIPEEYNSLPVTSIGADAFNGCTGITAVSIPKTVTSIGADAFKNCTGLKGVYISNYTAALRITFANQYSNPLRYAGNLYYRNELVTELVIPNIITRINPYTFIYCKSLTSVVIPEGVTEIGNYAFNYCNYIEELTLPGSLTTIGNGAFTSCSSVNHITLGHNFDMSLMDFNKFSALKAMSIPCSVTEIPEAIGYLNGTAIEGFTIYGVSGTAAEEYASAKGFNFSEYDPCEYEESIEEVYCSQNGIKCYKCIYCGKKINYSAVAPAGHDFVNNRCTRCHIKSSELIESPHFYSNNSIYNYTISKPGAKSITIIFSDNTQTESKYDFIYICDADGNIKGTYSGTELAGRRITISGDEIKIKLTTDSSQVYYGFRLVDVIAEYENCTHSETVTENGVSPTCTEGGMSGDVYCAYCNAYISANEPVEALGHDFSDEWTVDIEPTCVDEGTKSHHCSRCDERADETVVLATGVHTYGEWVISLEPLCLVEGSKFRICSVCDGVETETVAALGHDYSAEWTIDSVAAFENGEKSRHCSRCDSRTDIIVIPATLADSSALTFTLNSDGTAYTLSACDTSAQGAVAIPSDYEGLPVTAIGANAFSGCTGVTYVSVPETVTVMGASAFKDCTGLKGVYINDMRTWCNIVFANSYSNPVRYGADLYLDNELVTDLVIPEGVTAIKAYAFLYCKSITSVVLPEGVTAIGNYAFNYCNFIKTLEIPGSLTSIGNSSFGYCKALEHITFRYGFDLNVFDFNKTTALKSVSVPCTVTEITENTLGFIDGTAIEGFTIYAPKSNTVVNSYAADNGFSVVVEDSCVYEAVTEPAKCSFDGKEYEQCVYCGCVKNTVIIPATGHNFVNDRCSYCNIKKSELLESSHPYSNNIDAYYTVIKQGAKSITLVFSEDTYLYDDYIHIYDIVGNRVGSYLGSELQGKSITVEGQLVNIRLKSGYSGTAYGFRLVDVIAEFENCTHAETVTENVIPATCTESGMSGDVYCAYCNAFISESVPTEPGHIYSDEWTVDYEPTYTAEGEKSRHCERCDDRIDVTVIEKLNPLTFTLSDDGTSYIVTDCVNFSGAVIIPAEYNGLPVTAIGESAFYCCDAITSVRIPDSVTDIGKYAFGYCSSLTEVTLLDGITGIGYGAFYGCEKLEAIEIPDSVSIIGSSAFGECDSLTTVIIPDSVTSIGAQAFYHCYALESVEIPDGVSCIDSATFYGCYNLTSVTIPDSVTKIGSDAFKYCYNLSAITIPDSVTLIDDYAFYDCTGLKSIVIPDSVEYINYQAFMGCTALEEVKLSDGLIYINTSAFKNCTSLKTVTIPYSVKSIDHSVFENCTSLETVILHDDIGNIYSYAFAGCTSLKQINLPVNMFVIGDGAFKNCSALTSVGNIDGVYTICNEVFYGCTSLTEITIPDSVQTFGEYVFYGCTGLTTATLLGGFSEIPVYTFGGCTALESVAISLDITTVGANAFRDCTGLEYVFYEGTEADRENITINSNNKYLENALWHYNSTDHTFGEWVTLTATCTEGGELVRECTQCDLCETKTVDALGHSYSEEWTIDKEPTYTEEGEKSRHCTRCGEKGDVTPIAAKDFNDVMYAVQQGGTCNGKVTYVVYLKNGVSLGGATVKVRFDTDAMSVIGAESGACTVIDDYGDARESIVGIYEHGYAYNESNVYSIGYMNTNVLTYSDDKPFMIITFDIKEGYTTSPVEFYCDEFYTGKEFYVSKSNTPVTMLSEDVDLTVTEHISGDWIVDKEATVNGAGSQHKECTVCGETLEAETIPQLICDVPELVSVAQTENGVELVWNAVDGADSFNIYRRTDDDSWTLLQRVNGECTEYTDVYVTNDVTYYYTVEAINEVGTSGYDGEGLSIAYHIHSYGEWVVTEPTCTEDGSRYKQCVCSHIVTEVIEAPGHDYSEEWIVDVEATCTENGSESRHCSRCDSITDERVIESTGSHDYVLVSQEASHPHTKTYSCSVCGETKSNSEVLPNCLTCNFNITAIDVSSYKITSYIGTSVNVVIPATYNNCRVTTIANGCFKGNADIVSVEIPVGVTTIGSLAFMNCTSLEKVVIPATVTSIGANAFFGFKGSIYCTRDSYAHSYAVDNNIPYVIMDIASTENTTVDYDNFLVFTTVYSCDDLNDMLLIPSTTLALPVASFIQGNTELYGTGTEISVFDGDDYKGDYKVIVIGDLNGDSVCDVVDAAEAERVSSGQATATTEQIYAANGCISDELDVASYQTVVNNVLAN